MAELIAELIQAIWILLPAYAANMFPPLANGRIPIDFRKDWTDHRRIFGDGKTYEGFGFGIIMGTVMSIVMAYFQAGVQPFAAVFGANLIPMSWLLGLIIAMAALLGDLGGSFIKRRMGMIRGADAPILDQLNFVISVIIFTYFIIPLSGMMILFMILITPVLHRLGCIIGHYLKVKREPW